MPGPLTGIRVVDLCRYISGPFAGKLLGDLGADVVKVEQPGQGDPFRGWQSAKRPFSPQFSAYNRNKRGITLDLGRPAGREVLLALARQADVVLENFRPGTAERLGVGYEAVRAVNTRVIYCSISGFGPTGPYVHRPSYDSIASALSGLYSMLFDPQKPVPVGPPFSDLMSGLFAVQGILAALVARGPEGEGQKIEVSMLGAMLGFLAEPASTYVDLGEVYTPDSRPRRAQVYAAVAQDGLPLLIHLSIEPKFWRGLAAVLERPDLLEDPRFQGREGRIKHYYDLDAILKEAFAQRPRAAWFERLEQHDVPYAPIYRMDEVFQDPQVQHMDLEERLPMAGYEDLRTVRSPIDMSGTPVASTLPPPLLGQDTEAVLAELGYTPQQVQQLRAEEVI